MVSTLLDNEHLTLTLQQKFAHLQMFCGLSCRYEAEIAAAAAQPLPDDDDDAFE